MADGYAFRMDDGTVIQVPFEKMIEQDAAGFITVDGQSARRIREDAPRKEAARAVTGLDRPIVSDALGFPMEQLGDFERDRQANGFTGVEFRPDPHVPQFCQVHVSSQKEWARYVKHRGMHDRNSRNGSGAALTQEQMDAAAARVREQYPVGQRFGQPAATNFLN